MTTVIYGKSQLHSARDWDLTSFIQNLKTTQFAIKVDSNLVLLCSTIQVFGVWLLASYYMYWMLNWLCVYPACSDADVMLEYWKLNLRKSVINTLWCEHISYGSYSVYLFKKNYFRLLISFFAYFVSVVQRQMSAVVKLYLVFVGSHCFY